MKIIYTAIFGDYDTLREPLHIMPDCRYICFTDKEINSKTWELKLIKPKYDSVRSAREVKIMFHQYCPFFDGQAMWVDANQQITSDLATLFYTTRFSDLVLLKHPDRNCIYKEAIECMRLKKDDNEIINKQITEYIQKGYPQNNGLVATGMMIRRNTKEVNDFCERWFDEILRGSRRDQLSFNYVMTKHFPELNPSLLNFDTLTNNFHRCVHKK